MTTQTIVAAIVQIIVLLIEHWLGTSDNSPAPSILAVLKLLSAWVWNKVTKKGG